MIIIMRKTRVYFPIFAAGIAASDYWNSILEMKKKRRKISKCRELDISFLIRSRRRGDFSEFACPVRESFASRIN